MSKNATEKFLELFCGVEKILRIEQKVEQEISFSTLLRNSKNPLIRNNVEVLTNLGYLRNVLSHNVGNKIIALPSDDALTSICGLYAKLNEPKTLYSLIKNTVTKTSGEHNLLETLETMKTHNYSQLPVYCGSKFEGLLTGNNISRYFASFIDKGEIINSFLDEKVINILEHSEEQDKLKFISRGMTVYDFIEMFRDDPSPSGVYLITENGNSNESPLSIITQFDLPVILNELKM